MPMKAFNELTNLLLDERDREKFEWVIGSMLFDENQTHLVIVRGARGSGKSTLMDIVKKVYFAAFSMAQVYPLTALFFEDESRYHTHRDTQRATVFLEMNYETELERNAIVLSTTGDQIPVNKHHVLMQTIDSEVQAIVNHCQEVFARLGEDYYSVY